MGMKGNPGNRAIPHRAYQLLFFEKFNQENINEWKKLKTYPYVL